MKLARIGFLTWSDVKGPGAFSGSPWSVRDSLAQRGHEIVDIEIGPFRFSESKIAHRCAPMLKSNDGLRRAARSLLGPFLHSRGRILRRARAASRIADQRIQEAAPDVVIGVKMSWPIAFMKTNVPILYATDATASLLQETYTSLRSRGRGWNAARLELESRSLQRADISVFWFKTLIERAIADHGAERSRLHVAHPGSNFTLNDPSDMPTRTVPGKDEIRILFVAADPIRKQLSVAVATVKELIDRGRKARLYYIGPDHPDADRPWVEQLGRLDLDSQDDAAIHRAALRDSHVNLLPTQADMTPLSVNEASIFGLPSVVSRIGGLPEQVLDQISGRVISSDAVPGVWADAIEWVLEDQDRYRSLSQSCHDLATNDFSWEAWGRKVSGLIQDVAGTGSIETTG